MKIDYQILENEIKRILQELGVSSVIARIFAEIMLYADLAGRSTHGLARLGYYIQRIKDGLINIKGICKIKKHGNNHFILDGQNTIGQVTSKFAMEHAIGKAFKNGIGITCVVNSSHFGAAGYYGLMAIKNDMIGIIFTNARPAVAPSGSKKPTFGTNPYCIGFPSDTEYPFLIDCATSEIQRGDIEQMMPDELVYTGYSDAHAPFLTAENLLQKLTSGEEALSMIGGHKGYGLSLAIELFCSAFTCGDFLSELNGHYEGQKDKKYNIGHFFMAINPDVIISINKFKRNVGNVLREIKQQEGVRIPGEQSHYLSIEQRKNGIDVKDTLIPELKSLGMRI